MEATSPLWLRSEGLALSFLSTFCFWSDPTRWVPSPHLFVGLPSYTGLCIIHRRGQANSRVQQGLQPTDWKPMASVGTGVQEIVREALAEDSCQGD